MCVQKFGQDLTLENWKKTEFQPCYSTQVASLQFLGYAANLFTLCPPVGGERFSYAIKMSDYL
jgi:hypothetical protein